MHMISEATVPGAFAADLLPWSKSISPPYNSHTLTLVCCWHIVKHLPAWLPGAKFQREAAAWHQKATRQLHVPYEDFLQRLVSPIFIESVPLRVC